MSDLTIKTWVNQERNAFENFTAVLAARFEEAIFRALTMAMRNKIKRDGRAVIELPWGTYTAELISKGEAGNITPAWTPSKAFIKLLNGNLEKGKEDSIDAIAQESFDEEFEKLFRDFAAYGYFYPEQNKDKSPKAKGVRLTDDEVNYFLNGYAMVLATIAKDKQRDGKIFRLEINNGFPHGAFDFEYDDDEIKVTFVADKVFKQILKDDAAAASANGFDFTEIAEDETRRTIMPVTKAAFGQIPIMTAKQRKKHLKRILDHNMDA